MANQENLQTRVNNVKPLLGSLAEEQRWIARKGKIPCAVKGNNPGTSTGANLDHKHEWGNLDEAITVHQNNNLDGIGVVLGDGLVGIDIDHIDARANDDTTVQDIIQLMDTYTEVSPSGNGVHMLFYVSLSTIDALSVFMNKNTAEGIEIYWAKRYFTFTGNALSQQAIEVRDKQVLKFCKSYMPKKDRPSDADTNEKRPMLKSQANRKRKRERFDPRRGRPDATVVAEASEHDQNFVPLYNGSWKELGYRSRSEADLALANRLMYWTGRDAAQTDRLFRQSGLMRPKWNKYRGNSTYGAMTIEKAMYSDYSCEAYRKGNQKEYREALANKYRGHHGSR